MDELTYVNERNEPYPTLKGKIISITQNDQKHSGIYRGLTEAGQIVLNPHLNFAPSNKGERSICSWKPENAYITYHSIISAYPVEEKDLKSWIERHNFNRDENNHPDCLI